MEETNRWSKENEFLFGFGGLIWFLFYVQIYLPNSLLRSRWKFPYFVGIIPWYCENTPQWQEFSKEMGKPFPDNWELAVKRWSVSSKVTSYWKYCQCCSLSQLAFPLCTWWRVSRGMQSRQVGSVSCLCSGNRRSPGRAREDPLPLKVVSSHKATRTTTPGTPWESTRVVAPQFYNLKNRVIV